MTHFRDVASDQRFEQGFSEPGGALRLVWADYAVRGRNRVILHVEAEPELRGSGASGRFMQAMAEHARGEGLSLIPVCAYARAWFMRHPEAADVLGEGVA